ncbi:hypothetical protein FRIGORI9N_70062 [Frigoribacterium sp. 9N]|nr:hypothetical protein FRIGORI9N_70062 [Frigoribacterium sp. 9N]
MLVPDRRFSLRVHVLGCEYSSPEQELPTSQFSEIRRVLDRKAIVLPVACSAVRPYFQGVELSVHDHPVQTQSRIHPARVPPRTSLRIDEVWHDGQEAHELIRSTRLSKAVESGKSAFGQDLGIGRKGFIAGPEQHSHKLAQREDRDSRVR